MRTFIVADNQDITRAGLLFLLQQEKEVAVGCEVTNKPELIKALLKYPDAIVVLDYTLTDFTGSDELIILHERFEQVRWILFSDELSTEFLRRLLLVGNVFSVVMKDSSKEEIISAFHYNIRNERYICNHAGNLLLNAGKPQHPVEKHSLTTTEIVILKEIAKGKTTKEIAAERNLSFHTVNSHRKNIFRKLEVNSVHEATKYAMRAGLVDLAEYYI